MNILTTKERNYPRGKTRDIIYVGITSIDRSCPWCLIDCVPFIMSIIIVEFVLKLHLLAKNFSSSGSHIILGDCEKLKLSVLVRSVGRLMTAAGSLIIA